MATPRRTRLTVDVSPDLRRRVKLAAAARDRSVQQYVLEILEAAVPAAAPAPESRAVTARGIETLRAAQAEAMAGRALTTDSVEILRQLREERDEELDRAIRGR